MTEIDFTQPAPPQYSLLAKVLILLGLCLLGTFLFTLIGSILGVLTTPMNLAEIMENMQNPSGKPMWYLMIIITGVSHLGGFWIAGLIYLHYIEHKTFDHLHSSSFQPIYILPLLILTLAFMPVNELFMQLNQSAKLPPQLQGVENWMRNMEENAAKLTQFLTDFTEPQQFILAFIVIGIFAGIGEELIFRGILQNLFLKYFKNTHLAIWLAAIVFSAIHFQFYGFIPRLLLGAVYGYLYVWSGNLWVPIVGHIANNGIIVLLSYLHKIGVITVDVENYKTPLNFTLAAVVACVGLLYYFFKNKTEAIYEPRL
jgi:uncharacterized protein